jgi:hypothetical protein
LIQRRADDLHGFQANRDHLTDEADDVLPVVGAGMSVIDLSPNRSHCLSSGYSSFSKAVNGLMSVIAQTAIRSPE